MHLTSLMLRTTLFALWLATNGVPVRAAPIAGTEPRPAGSGTELQCRAGASALGAVTGSTCSGGDVTLGAGSSETVAPRIVEALERRYPAVGTPNQEPTLTTES